MKDESRNFVRLSHAATDTLYRDDKMITQDHFVCDSAASRRRPHDGHRPPGRCLSHHVSRRITPSRRRPMTIFSGFRGISPITGSAAPSGPRKHCRTAALERRHCSVFAHQNRLASSATGGASAILPARNAIPIINALYTNTKYKSCLCQEPPSAERLWAAALPHGEGSRSAGSSSQHPDLFHFIKQKKD